MNITLNTINTISTLPETLNQSLKSIISHLKDHTVNDHNHQTTQSTNDGVLPHISATLIHTVLETHDTKSYFFRSEKTLNQYKAGAHINIEFGINGEAVKRTYTLSSSPRNFSSTKQTDEFSITIKRVNEGLASNWLFENLKEGGQIKVSQPQGNFVLPYQPAGKILMLSAGSGVTPLMSMLRYLAEAGNRSDIVFLNYSQSPNDIIFHDELEQLSNTHENIDIHFSLERDIDAPSSFSTSSVHKGRISRKQLSSIAPDILEREIYLCGPQTFMKATAEILDKLKFEPSQLHLENFTADLSSSTLLGYSAEISFTSLEGVIQSSPSKTILEEAESAGLKPAAACRTGICRSCRCKKTSGTTVNLITGEESTSAGDYILPCVSVAKTATEIEL